MPVFSSSEQLYSCAQAVFDRVQAEKPNAADAVFDARLLIRFRCTEPAAEILINGRRRPVDVVYGPVKLRPELDVDLRADTLHEILLGELSLAKALASKAMKVRGPAWKTLALADLFFHAQAIYPDVLKEQSVLR